LLQTGLTATAYFLGAIHGGRMKLVGERMGLQYSIMKLHGGRMELIENRMKLHDIISSFFQSAMN
jgi:hypothetical protein